MKAAKKSWRSKQQLVVGGAFVLLLAGAYLLVTLFSPGSGVEVLTGKSPHETKQKLEKPPGTYGNRLFIPKINVDVAVVEGDSEHALEKGAWHRKPENGNPAQGGNFVLSAHRFVMSFTPQGTALKSPFYNIGKLVEGDELFVDYSEKRYAYEVTKKYTVKPDAVAIEGRTEQPRLTLYSCTLQGSADGRDVIEAVPVEKS